MARSAGWNTLGAAMVREVIGTPVDTMRRQRGYVAAESYQTASELAFHLPGHPEVFSLNLTGRPNQYDFWPAFTDRARPGDVLWVALDEADRPATIDSLARHFGTINRGGLVPLARNGEVIKHMRIWRLDQWRGTWPGRRLRSPP